MKKQFFVKKYSIYGDFKIKSASITPTIEVDFEEIERSLPANARIKPLSVQTTIEGDYFVVYGEYTTTEEAAQEVIAKEEVIEDLLTDEEKLPSVN